ncbi:hypothetical protein PROFUN_13582 [Planoprotostelium fungivorum]|uniref:Dynamin-type G domain-containing protein n=1 Tax=Planoprotostelium fungivorum TaxID=1890364 RepID=A0A2P6N3I6_9EUKA|nr:hypothetical protein PROFUN_13582 [Planoprotostelium fungivorum]
MISLHNVCASDSNHRFQSSWPQNLFYGVIIREDEPPAPEDLEGAELYHRDPLMRVDHWITRDRPIILQRLNRHENNSVFFWEINGDEEDVIDNTSVAKVSSSDMFGHKDKKEKKEKEKDKKDKRNTLGPSKLAELEAEKRDAASNDTSRQISRTPSGNSLPTYSAPPSNYGTTSSVSQTPKPSVQSVFPAAPAPTPAPITVTPPPSTTAATSATNGRPSNTSSPTKPTTTVNPDAPLSPTADQKEKGAKAKTGVRARENVEQELKTLNEVKIDDPEVHKRMYQQYDRQVYLAYDKLQYYARDLNTYMTTPEIVFVGKKSQGKSTLIETLLGEPINSVGGNGTKRPIIFSLVNNPSAQSPKFTIKKDPLKPNDRDTEVSAAEISAELSKRASLQTEEPIVVVYESFRVTNVNYIDTPALEGQQSENIVNNLCKPTHRLIVYVDGSNDWSTLEHPSIIKQLDPDYARTIFVYTSFSGHLSTLSSTREVNKYLSGALPDVKSFFVSSPSEAVKATAKDIDSYQKKVYQYGRRDLNTLESLSYDKRHESQIGIHAVRHYVLDYAWRFYEESIPRVLKQLRVKKAETTKQTRQLQAQLAALDTSKLRSLASNYVITFLQTVERLIEGTSEGNPGVNGQTLDEEKFSLGDGDWLDHSNRPIRFDPASYNILYWDNKLYGGQQFERLLSEFKGVAEHIQISAFSVNDVATAAGINKLNNIPNYHWAASDLAQQKSQESFLPLIEQLTIRAVYIMKRLAAIVRAVLDARRKKASGPDGYENPASSLVEDADHYRYFTNHVEELYFNFIESTAKQCKEKALDEFYSTRTIYWESTVEFGDRGLPLDRNGTDDTRNSVENLATELFLRLKERITKNVLLKFYNFFLVPIQSELWGDIQGKVNTLGDTEFEQVFELNDTKAKLSAEIKRLESITARATEQESEFVKHVDVLTHEVSLEIHIEEGVRGILPKRNQGSRGDQKMKARTSSLRRLPTSGLTSRSGRGNIIQTDATHKVDRTRSSMHSILKRQRSFKRVSFSEELTTDVVSLPNQYSFGQTMRKSQTQIVTGEPMFSLYTDSQLKQYQSMCTWFIIACLIVAALSAGAEWGIATTHTSRSLAILFAATVAAGTFGRSTHL